MLAARSRGAGGPGHVRLNGLPIDSFIDGTSLDPWALSRVEVQRGPAAVMNSNYLAMDFAGNTTPLAGITNFVLREKVDAPVTRLQAGLGSWATVNAQAYTQGRSGDLHYFFGGSWEHSDYTNYGTPGSWLNMQQFPQYTSVRLYGKTTFFFGGPEQTDQSVSVFAHYYGHSGAVGRPNRDFACGYGTINALYNAQLTSTLTLQVKGERASRTAAGERTASASIRRRPRSVSPALCPCASTMGSIRWSSPGMSP